jgi:beta-glucosidase-like glycosyl hydrolase
MGLLLKFGILILSNCLITVYSYSSLPEVQSLTLDQKIGQLFIGGAYSDATFAAMEGLGPDFDEQTKKLIRDYSIGGVILKGYWNLGSEIVKIQEYQSLSSIPLLIAQDLEWGLTMRIQEALRFPKNMTLGAVQDIALIEAMGREVGRQIRCLGVNYSFAPDVDVNNNPANPVIHLRSFGDDPHEVAKRGIAMMRGLQSAGVLACAKHFPGHGDTATDSHVDLPLLPFSVERLQTVEFYPFRELIRAGVMSVMTAHLSVPALDPSGRPASLSKAVVTEVLQRELGFQGLKVTDDLLMDGVRKSYTPGEACLEAFLAGNDLLLTAATPLEGIRRIKQAVLEGLISEEEITRRAAKVLQAKAWLMGQRPIEGSLLTPEALALKKQLFEEAITLVNNRGNVIPLSSGESKIGVLQIGESLPSPFYEAIAELNPSAPLFIYGKNTLAPLQDYQTIIVGLLGMTKFRHLDYGLNREALGFIRSLAVNHRVIVVVFGSPYSLPLLNDPDELVLAYEDDPDAQAGAAKALFGKIPFKGKLPVK